MEGMSQLHTVKMTVLKKSELKRVNWYNTEYAVTKEG